MYSQQQQTALLNSIFSEIGKIKIAYENLGIGDFDNPTYQEIIAIELNAIETRYKNFVNLQFTHGAYGMVELEEGLSRHEKQIVFDSLEELMPSFRGYKLPYQSLLQLITISEGVPQLSNDDQVAFFAQLDN